MKNLICLKGLCLKASETLKPKKIEKNDIPDAHICSGSNAIPSPQNLSSTACRRKERLLICLTIYLCTQSKSGKGSRGKFSWLKYVLFFLTMPQTNNFLHVFYAAEANQQLFPRHSRCSVAPRSAWGFSSTFIQDTHERFQTL